MLVKDVMTPRPVMVTEDTPVFDAMDMMRRHRFSRLIVVRHDELVGIVTELDLVRVAPSAATTLSVWEQNALLSKMKVREVMTPQPITVSPTETVEEAARMMSERGISGLPVVEQNKVVGIVTERDVFQALISLMHGATPGARLTISVQDQIGVLAKLAGIISSTGINILAVANREGSDGGQQLIVKLNTEQPQDVIKKLEAAGYNVVHVAIVAR